MSKKSGFLNNATRLEKRRERRGKGNDVIDFLREEILKEKYGRKQGSDLNGERGATEAD